MCTQFRPATQPLLNLSVNSPNTQHDTAGVSELRLDVCCVRWAPLGVRRLRSREAQHGILLSLCPFCSFLSLSLSRSSGAALPAPLTWARPRGALAWHRRGRLRTTSALEQFQPFQRGEWTRCLEFSTHKAEWLYAFMASNFWRLGEFGPWRLALQILMQKTPANCLSRENLAPERCWDAATKLSRTAPEFLQYLFLLRKSHLQQVAGGKSRALLLCVFSLVTCKGSRTEGERIQFPVAEMKYNVIQTKEQN